MPILKKFIGANQVDEAKIRLNNNSYLRARNAANDGDINLLRVTAADIIEFASLPQFGGSPFATQAYVTSNGANTSLSNLSGVAFNTDLVFDVGSDATITTEDDEGFGIQILSAPSTVGATGTVIVGTGLPEADSDSGNILLQTANPTGTGVQGFIELNSDHVRLFDNTKTVPLRFYDADGSAYAGLKAPDTVTSTVTYDLPAAPPASNGYVLSSTTAGVMSWVAQSGGGANTALSNLASTAVNADIIADADGTRSLGSSTISWANLYVGSLNGSGSDASNINMAAGNFLLTTGQGGDIQLRTSDQLSARPIILETNVGTLDADVNSGSISLNTAATTGTGNSGDISLQTGSSESNSGSLTLSSGTSSGGQSGNILIQAGGVSSAGDSHGAITLTTSDATTDDVNTGNVTIRTGNVTSASLGATSGNILIETGGHSDNGAGGTIGNVTVRSGEATSGSTTTGNVSVHSGNSNEGSSGNTLLFSGDAGTGFGGTSGNVLIYSGTGDGSGSVEISTGQSNSNGSGAITLITGDDSSAATGDITLTTGSTTSSTAGSINLTAGNGLDDDNRGTINMDAKRVAIATGVFQMPLDTADPSLITYVEGDMYFNTTSNAIRYYDGAAWQSIGGAGGANTALSNLTTTAINQNLLPDTDGTLHLGSDSLAWNSVRTYNIVGPTANGTTINISTGQFDLLTNGGLLILRTNDTAAPQGIYLQTNIGGVDEDVNTGFIEIGSTAATGTGVSGIVNIETGDTEDADSGDITIQTGASTNAARGDISLSANQINLTGSIIPTSNEVFNLGSQTNMFDVAYIGVLENEDGENVFRAAGTFVGVGSVNLPLRLRDTSLAGSSNGYVWTLQDNATGEGAWAAGPAWNKEVIVLDAGMITAQAIVLAETPIANSVMAFVRGGNGPLTEGASYEYTMSGATLTFLNDIATGGASELIAGDIIVVQYQY